MEIISLKLSESPQIFSDYLSSTGNVSQFFPHNFRDSWDAVLTERGKTDYPRKGMATLLEEQNRHWNAPEASLENIQKLQDRNTFAVVTGQQAGFYGGPLYTFYKTMTVLKLTKKLQKEYPQYQFVPVFWIEVNDSDFAEIAAIQYLNKENQLTRLSVEEPAEDAQKPIAARKLDDQILAWQQQLADDFFDTEFKDSALQTLKTCFNSGRPIVDAFAELLLQTFGRHGLVCLNPAGKAVCELAGDLFKNSLAEPEKIVDAFADRSNALQTAGYQPQIRFQPNQTLLFFNDSDMRRVRIDRGDDGQFQLKYPDGYRSAEKDHLLKACSERPEYLSPNVALRPIMQDTLLPTVAYVAGPSEMAYFGQVAALYEYFNLPMPVIYPRHRITLSEKKVDKNVQKNNADYAELLAGNPNFIEEFLRKHSSQTLFQSVESVERQIKDALESLRTLIAENDQTLVGQLDKTRQNIEGSFGKLSGRITRSLEEKNKIQVNQLERVLQHLMPESTFQERKINIIYFAIKYGMGFLDELYELLPEDTSSHYVVKL